jgi:DNA helicase HerA-like ATPase
MHVLGKTGSGKSYFLAGLFLALVSAGMPATLIDPHGDLAELVLSLLIAEGRYSDPQAFERLVYLDLPAAAASGRYLPFNYLQQPYDDHAMAELVAEAARRAWPELAHGAPTFENILKHSVIALRQAHLPLTALAELLTDRPFRERVLAQATDPQVVRFFHARMDQWGRDEAHMKESTLNRADLLTLSPVLRHSLGAAENRLSFRELLDSAP